MKHSIFYIYFKTVYFRMLLPMTNTFPLRNVCFYFMARLLQIFMLTCPEIAFPKFYEPLHLLQKRDPNKIFFSSLLKFSFKINDKHIFHIFSFRHIISSLILKRLQFCLFLCSIFFLRNYGFQGFQKIQNYFNYIKLKYNTVQMHKLKFLYNMVVDIFMYVRENEYHKSGQNVIF